jgi:hypothetical protein
VDRFAFDARWKYAAGGLDFDYPGFVHTVLADMRARLARSARIFQVTLEIARQTGLVGRVRPPYFGRRTRRSRIPPDVVRSCIVMAVSG